MTEEKTTGQNEEAKKPAKRTPTIEIKLSAADYLKFSEFCRMEGKTRTALARAAILSYMDKSDQGAKDEVKDRLATSLEAMQAAHHKDTERLAKMIARVMMDVGTVQQVFFDRAAKDTRKELWAAAKRKAAERLQHKRKGGDPEATEIMNHALGREA
jgi:sorbitol-specific phosphotransferase system component IIBC